MMPMAEISPTITPNMLIKSIHNQSANTKGKKRTFYKLMEEDHYGMQVVWVVRSGVNPG
jgi:hypothetical protein